jgi:hypothetical protein
MRQKTKMNSTGPAQSQEKYQSDVPLTVVPKRFTWLTIALIVHYINLLLRGGM